MKMVQNQLNDRILEISEIGRDRRKIINWGWAIYFYWIISYTRRYVV